VRLLTSSPEHISKIIDGMEKESTSIKEEALKFSWYMRGGVTYEQALQLSPAERDTVNQIIKENLETTKKTGLNFF
jgi:hypothetical protein